VPRCIAPPEASASVVVEVVYGEDDDPTAAGIPKGFVPSLVQPPPFSIRERGVKALLNICRRAKSGEAVTSSMTGTGLSSLLNFGRIVASAFEEVAAGAVWLPEARSSRESTELLGLQGHSQPRQEPWLSPLNCRSGSHCGMPLTKEPLLSVAPVACLS
jgi:hypothetical protein